MKTQSHPTHLYFLVFSVLTAMGAGTLLALGLFPDVIWGHDLPHHMDAAWRIAQGQIPRIDYYHHAYEIYHATIAAFIIWFGPHLSAITFAHALYAFCIPL